MKLINVAYKNIRRQIYNIGIINKDIEYVLINDLKKGDITWLKHNYNDRFFADPFLLKEDNQYFYILAEEYCFDEKLGKIVLLTINKEGFILMDRKLLIEEKYHLSFPFCEPNCNIIMPESCRERKLEKYIVDLDNLVVVKKETLLNEGLIDAIKYIDENGKEFLIGSKNKARTYCYLYVKKDGEYQIMNNGNPVVNNISESRSAGRIFKYKNELYRPIQDCKQCYGRQINIMKIVELSEKGYKAKLVKTVNSDKNPPYNRTFHTFNVYSNYIIVDGSYFMIPLKPLFKNIYKSIIDVKNYLFNK